ncbi:MAG TPA: alpha-glucosidase/alpha-galactosidase [Clostridia bacterium]|nr:alpha-glucosidase/alpha-galactosidase [Clostridia bacterium]
MAIKVAFIGAGSIGFTRRLLTDILSVPELRDIDIRFMDIDEENLSMVTRLCERDIAGNGLDLKITSTLDRRLALKDADYVINTVRIGGLEAFETDVDIPMKYGVNQCVGDTLCAGGIMYGQRGIAFILDLCKDIREVSSENVLMLNYANPNAMMTWAANEYGGVRTLGLCHGVQGGHGLIADALGLPKEEVDIICAGINHQTWYISIRHKGKDMNPLLLDALKKHEKYSRTEKVRIDMMERFGYFSTESNGHLSEYVAWYRKRHDEIMDWIDLGVWIDGEPGGYLRQCRERKDSYDREFPEMMEKEPNKYDYSTRSHEHGSFIIEGLETGRVYRGHFNVRNGGCITNLPEDAIVEVPGYIDANGINIPIVGDLPLGCAAVCQQSIDVQRLAVRAAVSGDVRLLKQAMMMDPLTGAVLNPPEIWKLTDEMLVAQEDWLPQYKEVIAGIKQI